MKDVSHCYSLVVNNDRYSYSILKKLSFKVNKLSAQIAHLECQLNDCRDERQNTEEYCRNLTEEKLRCSKDKCEIEHSKRQVGPFS